ncbi:protein RUBCNL-like [Ctenocephalides felis]|nr:protein RUBCNL-like [Ctenocephalides felis]
MNDFIQVKNGDLLIRLNELVKNSDIHVTQCELCTARGFVCEFCCKETIFPWQSNVTRCEICGSCYHSVCWNKIMTCSKCIRIGKRKADKAAP